MPQSAASRTEPPHAEQPSTNQGRKPVEKFHDGPVHVSIWENQGPRGAFRAASFQLRYKDEHDQWQTGYSYAASALKHLESAAREARSRIETWQQATGNSRDPG